MSYQEGGLSINGNVAIRTEVAVCCLINHMAKVLETLHLASPAY